MVSCMVANMLGTTTFRMQLQNFPQTVLPRKAWTLQERVRKKTLPFPTSSKH